MVVDVHCLSGPRGSTQKDGHAIQIMIQGRVLTKSIEDEGVSRRVYGRHDDLVRLKTGLERLARDQRRPRRPLALLGVKKDGVHGVVLWVWVCNLMRAPLALFVVRKGDRARAAVSHERVNALPSLGVHRAPNAPCEGK